MRAATPESTAPAPSVLTLTAELGVLIARTRAAATLAIAHADGLERLAERVRALERVAAEARIGWPRREARLSGESPEKAPEVSR